MCHYDFVSYQSTGSAPVGHFAQIVWKGSKKFGIAREFKGDSQTGCVYIVARYSPKKMSGQESENIDKGRFTPAVCRVQNKNAKGATLTQSKFIRLFKNIFTTLCHSHNCVEVKYSTCITIFLFV